jgi:hypothetical protein
MCQDQTTDKIIEFQLEFQLNGKTVNSVKYQKLKIVV